MGRVIAREATRETVTPNAAMTTLASPTVGGTDGRSLWRVEMLRLRAGDSAVVAVPGESAPRGTPDWMSS